MHGDGFHNGVWDYFKLAEIKALTFANFLKAVTIYQGRECQNDMSSFFSGKIHLYSVNNSMCASTDNDCNNPFSFH